MASKSFAKRILAALGALDAADGPIGRLEAARRLREAAEELEAAQVEAARKAGATWIEIGACYGLTKQGAQQRFRAAHNQVKAVTAAPETKKTEPADQLRGLVRRVLVARSVPVSSRSSRTAGRPAVSIFLRTEPSSLARRNPPAPVKPVWS